MIDVVPDELCEHVQLGATMAGGFVFAAETPPINVGMCEVCLNWCYSHFDEPQKLEASDPPYCNPCSGRRGYAVFHEPGAKSCIDSSGAG